ncbi:unnamed protein product [Darwinula stevensoni]|uniref:DNA-directed RNA polymerase III subunit RPC9 n=1 Tax=Darwinula stevensoni TaxID=69355 RepID=A0A7R9FQP7_9CRUS|nr:unnamed protein product [Darwinula stevensoni]CAG0900135.1 unnamed protein product [Darwinula stevensoni]
MEVVKDNCAYLSNYEVLQLLKEVNTLDSKQNRQVNLRTVAYEASKYLEGTPCIHQSKEQIQKLMQALVPYNLTKIEKLQILNSCPTTPVEIQLIVEDAEERLTEEQVNGILKIIADSIPIPRPTGESESDGGASN